MNVKDLLQNEGDIASIIETLAKDSIDRNVDKYRSEYDGEHLILKRKDREIGSGKR